MAPLVCLLLVTALTAAPGPSPSPAARPAGPPGFAEVPWPGEAAFQSYGSDDDLMSMGITALAQDRDGFLWVASDLGLYRFDGRHFRNTGPKEGLPVGPDSRLWADPRDGVWTSTDKGLFRVAGARVERASGRSGLPEGPALSLDWDGDGRAWVAMGAAGLFRESASGTFQKVEGSDQAFVVARAPRHGGMLVLRPDGRAALWTPAAGLAEWGAAEGVPSSASAALEDGDGRLWVLGSHGLWWKGPGEAAFRSFDHAALAAGGDYRGLSPDGQGGLWVATVRGLLHVRGASFTHVTDRDGMPTKSAAQVLVDREGSLWYASNGLYRQLGLGAWHNQTTRQGLPTEIVWAVARDAAGLLWAGTNLGLAVQEGRAFRTIPGSQEAAVLSLVALPGGGLVAAGRPRAIVYVAPGATGAVAVPSPFENEPASFGVYRVFPGRDGSAWVVGARKIVRMVPDGATLRPAEALEAPGGINNAYCSLQARDGSFWFASRNGLLQHSQGRWRLWTQADGLPGTSLYGLLEEPDGSLLVSFYDSVGVTRLRPEGDHLRVVGSYRKDDGALPTDAVLSIHRDHQGRTWLLTDVGPVLLEENGYRAFGQGFGLPSQDMVLNSFHADQDGVLWFANARSIARFDTAAFPWTLPVPAPDFEDLRLGGRPAKAAPGLLLEVQPGKDSLQASLSSRSYSRAKALSYQVRIDGLDSDWRSESSGKLHYLALPSGPYTLRARAVADGRPGPEAEVAFRVLPRWYETWPLRLSVLAALAAALWQTAGWRQRQLRLANEALEAEVRSRTQEVVTANASLLGTNQQLEREVAEHMLAKQVLEAERIRLQQALDEVKTLRGIVPICMHCKEIRDDKGFWSKVETYVTAHTEAQFSHGICPDCYGKLYEGDGA